MKNYHNAVLPNFLALKLKKKRVFKVDVLQNNGMLENRSFSKAFDSFIENYTIDGILSKTQFEILERFFIDRRSKRYSFWLKDHADYHIKNYPMITGPKQVDQIELKRYYGNYEYQLTKEKLKIIPNEPLELLIYQEGVDGSEKESRSIDLSEYRIDYDKSLIEFKNTINLREKEFLVASYSFYKLVRFDTDFLEYKVCSGGSVLVNRLSIVEVADDIT